MRSRTNFVTEGRSFVRVIGTWKKEMRSSFDFFSAAAKWIEVTLKAILNLSSRRWLSSSSSQMSSDFTSVGSWKPKILFALGLVSFNYGWWKIWIFKKLMLHIDMRDNVCNSNSVLTIRLWNYIKKLFRAFTFLETFLSLDVPPMAPVIAKDAWYFRDEMRWALTHHS